MDDLGARLVTPAVALAREWLRAAEASAQPAERAEAERLRALAADPAALAFARAFFDRVLRPESDGVAAHALRAVAGGALPAFLAPLDRSLLRLGAALAPAAPFVVMPLARRRLRRLVGGLLVERAEPAFSSALAALGADGFGVNVNLLGELVLGEEEAARRRAATIALLARSDVRVVSVKASAVASQRSLWGYDFALARVEASLREILRAAAAATPARLVNLDMEDYEDLELTLDAFMRLLDEPELAGLEAGIVLQAYLPDCHAALERLSAWAEARRARGGAGIRIRLVKGANLAMERVDAELHGFAQAPYATKADTDASYKRLVDRALDPARTAVRIGIASHNLFDVAWAKLLAEARGVEGRVELEMLKGMAPGVARTVRAAAGALLLYTPVVDAADFPSALAYLFRRFEENASGENFLRHLLDLARDAGAFAAESARFEAAVAARERVATEPRRRAGRRRVAAADGGFANAPDADPTDPAVRAAFAAALAEPPALALPAELDVAGADAAVARALRAAGAWSARPAAERRALLRRVADVLEAERPRLVAVMAHEAAKTVAEGNREVSEAVDAARYYAERALELERRPGAAFEPLGAVLVAPPWNFPIAIPAGGAFAALAAGNAVILKPAPQTPRSALAVAECAWRAGVPREALQLVRAPDAGAGERLVSHPDVGGIVLTGAYETAEHFARLAPETPLFAETSGKNALVILPDADLDLAVADLVSSAFGHAGQKCSAASLAILVGDVARSQRFRRQLVDAARSLVVAPATRPEAAVGPLIGPPPEKLARALGEPPRGQEWWLAPRALPEAPHLWSPGIFAWVEPGSWFHQTECFGPVLGLVRAKDLDEALAIQNGVPYGLTGGIHTLDPARAAHWLGGVEVGNAYVNRGTTGAIVGRQPFGGWKRSVVGPGAKAGGPNYIAQLGHWRDAGPPGEGAEPEPAIRARIARAAARLDPSERERLAAAVRSDAYWWEAEFAREHDPSALACEANRFRYRRFARAVLRIAEDAAHYAVARALAAAARSGSRFEVSAAPGRAVEPGWRCESAADFARRMADAAPERIRLLGSEALPGLGVVPYVDRRPPVDDGRIELARYLREQAVSATRHRFGSLAPELAP
jgi:RHH-type proline utilization regulon transcriptional repressor/proline dehydrogenase/delta 1-pyrroline-5-carboxylate dehydrogenase